MKKLTILIILVILFSVSVICLSAEEAKYDFRKTNWGMSKEQVKATEKGKIVLETEDEVIFMVPDFDANYQCSYSFLENTLYQSLYSFVGEHTNKNDYINDYEKLKLNLINKYGKPKNDKIEWKNSLFYSDKQEWGTAISIGHLIYWASWETSTTEITLALMGDNYKINLAIAYYSKELKPRAIQMEKEGVLKNL